MVIIKDLYLFIIIASLSALIKEWHLIDADNFTKKNGKLNFQINLAHSLRIRIFWKEVQLNAFNLIFQAEFHETPNLLPYQIPGINLSRL